MAINLKVYDSVDVQTKDLVNGYIRYLLEGLSTDIPQIINVICCLFFYRTEEWDANLTHDALEITDDILTHKGANGFSSAFMRNVIDHGINRWTFRINSYNNWGNVMIGIWNLSHDIELNKHIGREKLSSYVYDYAYAEINEQEEDDSWSGKDTYGVRCNQGSIIKMIVNFNDMTIQYVIEEVWYGKAYDFAPGKYKCAVTFFPKGSQIELLSFTQF